MNRIVVILVSGLAVILLFLAGVIAYSYFENRNQTAATVIPTPIVPVVTTVPSPTVSVPATLRGTVLSISTQTVGYKDSLVLTMETSADSAIEALYITPQTRVFNSANNIVPRTTIRAGMNVVVVTTPGEGAFEATEVQIIGISPTVTP
jgi:hypothetical protein